MESRRSRARGNAPRGTRAASAATAAAARLRRVLNGLPVFVGVLSPEGVLTEVNDEALGLAGLDAADVLGLPLDQTYWWSHSEAAREQLQDAIRRSRQGEMVRYDVELRVGPDRVGTFDFTLAPLRDERGRVTQLVASAIDFAAYQRTARDLESPLRGTLENSALGVAHLHCNGRWLRVNETLCRMLGQTADDLLARTFPDLAHPDDRERVCARLEALERGELSAEPLELRCIAGDGEERWLRASLSLQEESQRGSRFVIAVIDEITSQKRYEEEFDRLLTRQQQRTRQLHQLARASLEINCAASPEAVLRAAAHAAHEIIGARCAAAQFEPHGRWAEPLVVVTSGDERSAAVPSRGGACPFGFPWLVRFANRPVRMTQAELETHPEWRRRSDSAIPMRGWLAAPLVARDGRNLGLIHMTDRIDGEFTRDDEAVLVQLAQLASAALEHARSVEELRQANRHKSEFLAHVSHEIRTPMNAILGMARLGLDEELSPTVRDALETIHGSAENLLRLLNDLLDFSRIEAGVFRVERERFRLRSVVAETVKVLAVSAFGRGLELNCRIPASVPDTLVGDAGRLRQILTNLLGNAIKFTERGDIVLRVAIFAEDADSVTLQFTVSDTGIGIPPEARQTIFAAFAQADESTTRRFGGTGLGLAICSQLLAQMGGRLWVESEVGQGSDFHFTLSFAREADQTADAPSLDRLRGRRALVVSPGSETRQVVEELLVECGMQVVAVDSVEAARQQLARGDTFAVALADARLPDHGSFALAQHVRRHPDQAAEAVLLLSAVDRHALAERLEALEPIATVEKPVIRDDLLQTLAAAGRGERRSLDPVNAPAPNKRADGTTGPLRILLVEDTPANQKVISAILNKHGHDVRLAANGPQAVAAFTQQSFDLVLMDLQMPIMDGIETTAALRAFEHGGTRTPIVAMTARTQAKDRELCQQAGMDGYITKPIDADELLAAVDAFGRRAAANGATPATAGARIPAVANFDSALGRMGGSRKLLSEMAGFFLEDASALLQQIRDTVRHGATADMQRAAHSLKGLAANFDAHAAVEAAYRVEQGDAPTLRNDPAAIAALEHEVARLRQAITEYVASAGRPA